MQKAPIYILQHHLRIAGQQDKHFTIFTFNQVPYLLCFQPTNLTTRTLLLYDQETSYLCGLDRFVSLNYGANLRQLLSTINNASTSKQDWLAIFEILSYRPEKGIRYQLGQISYGEEVYLKVGTDEGQLESRVVSNCFNQKGDYFYLIQNQRQEPHKQWYGQVVNMDKTQIYGISVALNQKDLVCIPFQTILKSNLSRLSIHPSVTFILSKTVYLQIHGNYSTGTLISDKHILTVRHAFSGHPSKGATINVKFFPYQQNRKAILVSEPVSYLDAVILCLIDLKVGKIAQEGQQIRSVAQSLSQKTVEIGQNIQAVGFGRYNYSASTFSKVNLVLPTLMVGIVSKTLTLHSQIVMFKTDASLYNGFSGCAIWSNQMQVGMAVFCVKNITTSSHIYKQNYSYLAGFLKKWFQEEQNEIRKNRQLQDLLNSIGNFTTRGSMKIRSKL